jgi:hypothetical protein
MRDFGRARLRRSGMKMASVLAVVLGVLALAGGGGIASANNVGPGTAITYGSTWSYTGSAPASGWMNPGFDASSWATDSGPFSNTSPVSCASDYGAAGLPTTGNSDFPIGGSIFLRNSFFLPADAWGLHLTGTIDNYASVWVNGSSYGTAIGGNCSVGDISVDVPNTNLQHGAANSNLVAVNAADDGFAATYFDLQATYGAIAFGNQPIETQKNSPLTDSSASPIRVTITPPDGGAAVPDGTEVDLSLQTISGTGTISGGTAYTSGGVATFPALKVSASGEYRLVATSGGATVTSNAFVIADQITSCPAGQTCTSTGGTGNTQVTASSSFSTTNQLAVSVIDDGAGIPANVCGSFVPRGAGSFINILNSVVGGGNITATWTLAKSLVLQMGNPGAAHFDICLGAENLQGGTTPWTTKSGAPSTPVLDSNLGATLYWGVLPDCSAGGVNPRVAAALQSADGPPTGPCILHRDKNAGNEVVSFYLPYPWDAGFHGG